MHSIELEKKHNIFKYNKFMKDEEQKQALKQNETMTSEEIEAKYGIKDLNKSAYKFNKMEGK